MSPGPMTAAGPPGAGGVTGPAAASLKPFVFGLFFIFGGITSLNDVIIPKLKALFTLSYTEAMLVQFCFFAAYLIIGIPGARLVNRLGYMRGAVVGLLAMMTGCLMFIPASQTASYPFFLGALFVLASGVVVVQVVANPLISMLGAAQTVHSRLTFAQAFNSLGTTLFPYVGAILILGGLAAAGSAELSGPALDAYRAAESQVIVHAYLALAILIATVAGAVWLFRNRLPHHQGVSARGLGLSLLGRPRFGFGTLAIFLYVGAEVAIGSLIVAYISQAQVMALGQQDAGKLVGLYWGGAMVGRFIGSAVLRVASPGKVLAVHALAAIGLILVSIVSSGAIAGYSLLAVGLANSIMFPTIFSLASDGLADQAAEGSGLLNVAIFGGAVVPLLTGAIADASGSLAFALLLPAACYAVIASFGWLNSAKVTAASAA